MPESYEQAWRRLDAEADARFREQTAAQVHQLLTDHAWLGGYECHCGHPVWLPRDWGQHLLELALFDDVTPVRHD